MSDYINTAGHIYDIQGYAVHDGPGIRTTVYTKGCPLSCLWCHSPESQRHDFELSYLKVKCLGADLCSDACINACPKNAISRAEPVAAIDGSGTMIQKAGIDRSLCDNCLECTKHCVTSALFPAGRDTTTDEVFDRIMRDKAFFKKNDGGITISGGEAMAQFEFTHNLAKRLKENGIHICLDTTGFAPEWQYMEIAPFIDLFLYDLKHMNSEKHKKLTGVGNELILSNALFLSKINAALQIRVPIIPKLTDSEENLRQTAEFCVKLGDAAKLIQLLPYHKTGRMKYERIGINYKLTNVEPPDDEFMQKTLAMFQSYGLNAQLH